ncbi:Transcription elongation factor GreA [Pseudidiomarina piscicola]|uniref:Transcription elongation factor GreA n=1 Tax=Pseudidiomarina piscicola TaxID=2614830 RepID=A0A6S6WLL2_9GAMM|nr:GreA/GreB family elongation factor [Pseudidiomarina piscicola]CAB0150135.1 Transcription elongation factor GreA [Pseudidiomarina piscicola]VZT39575.1 Transcription elongation factor GreA [Pseudomonas aeruginosa]
MQPFKLQLLLSNIERSEKSRSRIDARVAVGSQVTLRHRKTKEQITFRLVTPEEAKPSELCVSLLSPIGSAVIGKRRGSVIELNWNGQKSKWEVLAVNRN